MSRPHLAKQLGAFDATLIVMGCIIASGIFMTPSVVAQRLHSGGLIIFAWLLGGAIALIGGFVFAELAARRPDVGGMYGYMRDAFHPMLAFMSGWTALLVSQSGAIAAVAVTFATYAHLWIPVNVPLLAIAAIAVTSSINCFGLREGVNTQNVLMILKIAAIAIIVAAGFFGPVALHHAGASLPPPQSGAMAALAALGAALIPVFYSYDGWQTAPFIDGEMKHSERALPLGLVLGVLGVVILYVAVTLGGLRMLGAAGLAATADTGDRHGRFGHWKGGSRRCRRVHCAFDARLFADRRTHGSTIVLPHGARRTLFQAARLPSSESANPGRRHRAAVHHLERDRRLGELRTHSQLRHAYGLHFYGSGRCRDLDIPFARPRTKSAGGTSARPSLDDRLLRHRVHGIRRKCLCRISERLRDRTRYSFLGSTRLFVVAPPRVISEGTVCTVTSS